MGLFVFTIFNVLISLLGIASGFVVFYGMLASKRMPRWTRIFLVSTVATSVTGFLFPYKGFTPALGFGILSLIVLGVAIYALHGRGLAGGWRKVYVITALFAQYLNVFVLVVQSFLKIPFLHALAPTQTEPPFGIAQGVVLVLFLVFGYRALGRFREETAAPPA